jgi:hypothetical protein
MKITFFKHNKKIENLNIITLRDLEIKNIFFQKYTI